MRRALAAYAGLAVIGAAWGLSAPVIKLATGAGFGAVTILLGQSVVNLLVLGVFLALAGRLRTMPRDPAHLRLYAMVGLFGMALPAWASYSATAHLPAGVISIIISLVPLFALPMALVLGTERFDLRRLGGVVLGAVAMVLLIAPDASLPQAAAWVWVPVAALAPFFYAVEGAYVHGTSARRADPLQTLWAGYAVGVVFALPLAAVDPAPLWPDGSPAIPWAAAGFVLSGLLGIGAYAGYLMLLRHAGAVFGAQVAYAVTGMGMVWAIMLLGERYSLWVWAALAVLFAGLFLVQPSGALARDRANGAAPGRAERAGRAQGAGDGLA